MMWIATETFQCPTLTYLASPCAAAHLAAVEGHLHCFKFLVRKMAGVTHTLKARNDHGETPRDLAERFYKDNILQYIDGVEKLGEHPETQEGEFAQLAAVELLTQRTGDSYSSDEELDSSNIKFFERHGVEGSTDSKEDFILDKAEKRNARKPCLTVRAYRRIQELQQLLEIAYSNYRQLGGITEEERKMKKDEKKVEKAVRELEAQLESERVRREKLESQLDGCRAEIGRLRESRGRARSPAAPPPGRTAVPLLVRVIAEVLKCGARKYWREYVNRTLK
ncbi:hypothetical protein ASZ78_010586 [Callipepla squamata]|uniref:Uncharacterized protein n=1 Tax=Callipepla squamata TaxID=9009 RepID=A0A226MJB0_CALSU|nr:hypothetical protein ASZ78_010586 [Callipepla squamata]